MKSAQSRQDLPAPPIEQQDSAKDLGTFGRYLTVGVALCIIIGVAIGQFLPGVPETLSRFTYAQVSIPVANLIWPIDTKTR